MRLSQLTLMLSLTERPPKSKDGRHRQAYGLNVTRGTVCQCAVVRICCDMVLSRGVTILFNNGMMWIRMHGWRYKNDMGTFRVKRYYTIQLREIDIVTFFCHK